MKVQIPICSHWQLYFQTGYCLFCVIPVQKGGQTSLVLTSNLQSRLCKLPDHKERGQVTTFKWMQKTEVFFPSYSIGITCYLNSCALLPDLHPDRLGERKNDNPRSKPLSREIHFTLPPQLHRPPRSSTQWHSPMAYTYQYSGSFYIFSVMSQIR